MPAKPPLPPRSRKPAMPKTAARKAAKRRLPVAPGAKGKGVAAPRLRPAKPKIPKATGRLTHEEADEVFSRLAAADPAPRTELHYVNPYTLLVAVALSAQMTDAGVNRATKALFDIADTPQKMVALGLDAVLSHLRTINFHGTKARNVIALSQKLIAEHGGEVPHDREALEALPGVGRKTANVVLNVVFNQPTMAVDTHVFRVANRTGLAPGKTPREVEDKLLEIMPERWALHAHHWLILHGRYTCVARKPKCPDCAIRDLCRFTAKTTVL